MADEIKTDAPKTDAPKTKPFSATSNAVLKALGSSIDGLTVLVKEKLVTIDYPSLNVCSEKHGAHIEALSKLGTVKDLCIDVLAGEPKEHQGAEVAAGPQRLTVRFV